MSKSKSKDIIPFAIRDDVPLPERIRKEYERRRASALGTSGRPKLYPFDEMGVGECFFAPCDQGVNSKGEDIRLHNVRGSAVMRASRQGKGDGKRFAVRMYSPDWVVCWRIA